MDDQQTKQSLIVLRQEIKNLLTYYKELEELIKENLLIGNSIYKAEKFQNLYNEVKTIKFELDELINTIDLN